LADRGMFQEEVTVSSFVPLKATLAPWKES
jgi:hypothetical protein